MGGSGRASFWRRTLQSLPHDITLFLGCTDALTAEFISARTGEVSISVTSKAKQLGTWRISNYTPEYRETSGVGKRKLMTMDEVLRMDVDRALVIIRGKKVLEVDKYDYSKHPEAKKLKQSKASAHIPAWRAKQMEQEKKRAERKAAASPKSEASQPPKSSSRTQKTKQEKKPTTKSTEPRIPWATSMQQMEKQSTQKPATSQPMPEPILEQQTSPSAPEKRQSRVVTATKDSILSKPKKED